MGFIGFVADIPVPGRHTTGAPDECSTSEGAALTVVGYGGEDACRNLARLPAAVVVSQDAKLRQSHPCNDEHQCSLLRSARAVASVGGGLRALPCCYRSY